MVTASSGASGSCSGSGLCVSLPASGVAFNTSLAAQDMQLDSPLGDGPAPSGFPSVSERLGSLNLSGWRMLATSPTGNSPMQIVEPTDAYIKDGSVKYQRSWAFASIDKQLAETPASVPRLVQQDPPFALWHCLGGSWSNASTGC